MMLTVFTPTYNRKNCLERLYHSLVAQRNQDFEWLIVDDGSTDDTEAMVQRFLDEKEIVIRYFSKENGGKHTAYNEGLARALGKWFVCVDADDYLAEQAVEKIVGVVTDLGDDAGVAAYKRDTQGIRLSRSFPENVKDCKISDLSLRYGCTGEFTFVFPTALAKRFPFPVFPGEKFVGESVVYDRIEKECRMRLLPEEITVCEYQQDGYSQNFGALMGRNPNGFCLYFLQRIDLVPSFCSRVVQAGKYWCFRWDSGNQDLKYSGRYKALVRLCAPVGLVFRIYYKLVRGF